MIFPGDLPHSFLQLFDRTFELMRMLVSGPGPCQELLNPSEKGHQSSDCFWFFQVLHAYKELVRRTSISWRHMPLSHWCLLEIPRSLPKERINVTNQDKHYVSYMFVHSFAALVVFWFLFFGGLKLWFCSLFSTSVTCSFCFTDLTDATGSFCFTDFIDQVAENMWNLLLRKLTEPGLVRDLQSANEVHWRNAAAHPRRCCGGHQRSLVSCGSELTFLG